MKLKQIYCPSCGGAIKGDLSKDYVFCPFCGQQLVIDHEKKEVTITHNININKNINKTEHSHYYDEARIEEYRTNLELAKHNDRMIFLAIMLMLLIGVFAGIMSLLSE